MRKISRIFQVVFAVPWLIFGLQHLMFANFVAGLVPAYFPARLFWAYLTGVAMIAAGVSFIINIKARLAAILLGLMILMFIVLIHVPKLTGDFSAINWTRALQDLALAATAFVLAKILSKGERENDLLNKIGKASHYLLAILLIVFGVEQFLNLDFLTAKVAPFLPARFFFVYLTGAMMIAAGASVLISKKAGPTALMLGTLMATSNLLLHVPLLASAPHNPLFWTAAILDLALTSGVFILASSRFTEENGSINKEIFDVMASHKEN